MTPEDLVVLNALASKLPSNPRSDWDGTNHYEITTNDSELGYWWLSIGDLDYQSDLQSTEGGKRLGAVMDFACKIKQHWPEISLMLEKSKENGI